MVSGSANPVIAKTPAVPTKSTIPNYVPPELKDKEVKKSPAQLCAEKGGLWDSEKQICILVQKEEKPKQVQETPRAKIPEGQIESTITKGVGGATMLNVGDQTYLGKISPEEINNIAQLEANKVVGRQQGTSTSPTGINAVGTQQNLIDQQIQSQQILSQLGSVGNISQAELNQLIQTYGLSGKQQLKEALPGALREAVPNALYTGAKTGLGVAVAGAVAGGAELGTLGGPLGIAIGAAAGVVYGLWKGIASAKKAEAKEDVTNAMSEFENLRKGISQVASLASSGYINEVEAVELYNAQLSRMLQIQAQVKYLQSNNIKDYLSDGSDDLAKIDSYLLDVAPAYKIRIQSALINPTSKVPYSDVILQDLADLGELQ